MTVRLTRLGLSDWLLGIASLLLLVDLFGGTWFEYRPAYRAVATMLGQSTSANGWQAFQVIGPLTLVVCVVGVAICFLTVMRRSPALPVVMTTLVAPVSLVVAILVTIRVLLDPPSVHLAQAGGANVIETGAGAYIGLALSVALFAGLYLSLRRDGVAPEDAPASIETLRVSN
jgi:hypothetical protein